MTWKLTPLAFAVSSSLLICSSPTAFAAGGGANGAHGSIYVSVLSAGPVGADTALDASGGHGADFSGFSLTTPATLLPATPGVQAPDIVYLIDDDFHLGGGGGAGGAGGGSFIGAMSIGGAASTALSRTAVDQNLSANGGHGGHIANGSLSITNITLSGADGGAGGSVTPQPFNELLFSSSGGVGGSGGGSVIGGLSIGGSGGVGFAYDSDLNVIPAFFVNSYGGQGGNISNLQLDLSELQLTGGSGGNGGNGPISAPNMQAQLLNGFGGSGGSAGAGGGSILAGISLGGVGGVYLNQTSNSDIEINQKGGQAGAILNNRVTLARSTLTGGSGGNGGNSSQHLSTNSGDLYYVFNGSGGSGGLGGATVTGGLSQGGAGGINDSRSFHKVSDFLGIYSDGGAGGEVRNHTLTLQHVVLRGAQGGAGGNAPQKTAVNFGINESFGSGGAGGIGGGSVMGGISLGGAAGTADGFTFTTFDLPQTGDVYARGGNAGDVSGNTLNLSHVELQGAPGGTGGSLPGNLDKQSDTKLLGSGGHGGLGGGSVLGGLSIGGTGGAAISTPDSSASVYTPYSHSDGGNAGHTSGNTLQLSDVQLAGATGGNGGRGIIAEDLSIQKSFYGGRGGVGGAGGGSIFGGYSQAGNGGLANTGIGGTANGGSAGQSSQNRLTLHNVTLNAAAGGAGGAAFFTNYMNTPIAVLNADGSNGLAGGSIFGGYSQGGNGGIALGNNEAFTDALEAKGGDASNSSDNQITLSGASALPGDIYGGYSHGGRASFVVVDYAYFEPAGPGKSIYLTAPSAHGTGGYAENNHITLNGEQLSIGGSIYGGYSADGDGILQRARAFSGNTLTLQGYRGAVEGIYNIEQYNWTLPNDVVNNDTLITIRGSDLVDLNGTNHHFEMLSEGNRFNENDQIVLISKAQGAFQPSQTQLKQGFFIIYDAELDINNDDEFVLRFTSKQDTTPAPPFTPVPDSLPIPAGTLNPTSKSLLQSRTAALSMLNQGADMVQEQISRCVSDMFLLSTGGSSRYKTGSDIKVSDVHLAGGARACVDLPDSGQVMLGAFIEHGTGNYHSRNDFADFGHVRGHGDLRYTGAGLALHMDVAHTGSEVNTAPSLTSKNGLYLDAALRAGRIKADYASNDLINADAKRAEYNSKSTYASVSAGLGYAWNLTTQQQLELYGRYSWSRIGTDKVNVGGDTLRLGASNSSRLRVGSRYNYALTEHLVPFAGVAYEYDFDGRASGKVYEFSLEKPELKGGSGVLELGVSTMPLSTYPAFTVDASVQGYTGQRKGASGSLSLNYQF